MPESSSIVFKFEDVDAAANRVVAEMHLEELLKVTTPPHGASCVARYKYTAPAIKRALDLALKFQSRR